MAMRSAENSLGIYELEKTHGTLVDFQPCETAVVGYFCPVTLRVRNGVSARKSIYIYIILSI